MNSFIILQDGISLSLGMSPHTIDRSHPNYDRIVDALREDDWNTVEELINIAKSLIAFGNGKIGIDVDNGVVLYAGEEIHGSLQVRILQMMEEGFSVEPLVNFLDNLMSNPSKRAVDELYGFLEHGKMPITEDGHFLAYKRVREDYTSVHDGKTSNAIGEVVKMDRNKVDDDKDRTCSHGLHFCSHEYLKSFSGAKVVVLKINPRDVVSIPTDYNNTKGRACQYEVVGELSEDEVKAALSQSIWSTAVVNDYDDADRDGDENDLEEEFSIPADDHGDVPTDTNLYDLLANETVSESYAAGYNRGYKDGRHGETKVGDCVVITEYVADTEHFMNGYKRGHKDGKAHTKKARFNVQNED